MVSGGTDDKCVLHRTTTEQEAAQGPVLSAPVLLRQPCRSFPVVARTRLTVFLLPLSQDLRDGATKLSPDEPRTSLVLVPGCCSAPDSKLGVSCSFLSVILRKGAVSGDGREQLEGDEEGSWRRAVFRGPAGTDRSWARTREDVSGPSCRKDPSPSSSASLLRTGTCRCLLCIGVTTARASSLVFMGVWP